MNLTDGSSGSTAVRVWSHRGTFLECPALASVATRVPSLLWHGQPCQAAVIEGSLGILGDSDLSRGSTLPDSTDGRMSAMDWEYSVGATSDSGSHRMVCCKSGHPRAEKVRPHRLRQNKGAAMLTKAPSAFRKIGNAVNRQGTLTITGSNVRLGTEMPVALSLF